MDPFSALALLGVATQGIGAIMGVQGAQQHAQAQENITRLQQQEEGKRREMMELSSRRSQLEVMRNVQRARSMALNISVNQGAQQGSGLQGAYGQSSGQAGFNLLGLDQNLTIGRNMFDLNSQISNQKIAMGDADTMSATGAGISSFGGSLTAASGTLRNLSGGPGGSSTGGAGASSGAPSWLNPNMSWNV